MTDSPTASILPRWAEEMRQIYRGGATSQFVLYGNVFDLVPAPDGKGGTDFVSLADFLSGTMFQPFDIVIRYDRGRGVRIEPPDPRRADAYKPVEEVLRFLKGIDAFRGAPAAFDAVADRIEKLDLRDQLPRDPKRALEIVDRVLAFARRRAKVQDGKVVGTPLKVAVVLDYAHFIAPQGDPIYVADLSQTLIQVQDWAANPEITSSFVATVLITENLADLNRSLVETPYNAKIRVSLPGADDIQAFLADLVPDEADFARVSEVTRDVLADKLVGLSRVSVRTLVKRAVMSGERITGSYLTRMKKEFIEKEAAGRLEFLESPRTLDDVAGHDEAKAWLREDAVLLKRGRTQAIPMGYLLTGRIGTGKTYLVECLSGEIGIPCVEMKNFREKWVGATEGNLEKVFSILQALGQVIVFVDEADQMTGKRGGGEGGTDPGLSGRVYGMLAKEMSDTRNRGRIIWIFATSRPDLVEVDLKRQGRLDVHIPLFPPGDAAARAALFAAMARKLRLPIEANELPRLPDNDQLGGNEMEGILVRALRVYETGKDAEERGQGKAKPLRECVEEAIADFRPSAHVERLELMDLLAVKECTDTRFLPPRFRKLSLAQVNARIEELKAAIGE